MDFRWGVAYIYIYIYVYIYIYIHIPMKQEEVVTNTSLLLSVAGKEWPTMWVLEGGEAGVVAHMYICIYIHIYICIYIYISPAKPTVF